MEPGHYACDHETLPLVEFLTNLAERYWKIFPPSQAENVVAMARAS
jgi:hypothetical protein